jgi:DNA-binding MarR family transcriptional regulator
MNATLASHRPLSALLSQVLVAFTVECNNDSELRMSAAGYPGSGLSLTVWYTLLRFLTNDGVRVEDLPGQASTPIGPVKFLLGCLERWRFVTLQPDSTDERPVPQAPHRLTGRQLRQGWGSGRGIRNEWLVRVTPKGRKAIEIWPGVLEEVETRWKDRFGQDVIEKLCRSLQIVAEQIRNAKPGVPPARVLRLSFPANAKLPDQTSLPRLLAILLRAFAEEFQRDSTVPMELGANTLRVLSANPIPEREIPRLTGCSPETSGIGWQIKRFLVIVPAPAGRRGKMVRLNARGLAAQASYRSLVQDIENRWKTRFGKENLTTLREQLERLFLLRNDRGPLLAQGLIPPEGVTRAGHQAPALGGRDVGVAARKRMHDLVEQTAEFVRDPANALPHFPLWDMNRGFGP